jgi:hypothetical protein
MTSTTNTELPTNTELLALKKAREAKIAAQGRETLPPWVNLEAIDIDWDDVEYRREHETTGRLLVDALARRAKQMMPVSEWPDLEIEGPVYERIVTYLGFDTIDYVVRFMSQIAEMVELRDNDEAYDRWTNDPERRDVWENHDPVGWFDLRLEPTEAIPYVVQFIERAGGTVTWPAE